MKRHLVLPETSEVWRMTDGIRIIYRLQWDDSDPELMMCMIYQEGIELNSACWLTANEPGIKRAPNTVACLVMEGRCTKYIYIYAKIENHYSAGVFHFYQGSKINLRHLSQTAGLCYISCTLWHLMIMFMLAHVQATETGHTGKKNRPKKKTARSECQWPISIGCSPQFLLCQFNMPVACDCAENTGQEI